MTRGTRLAAAPTPTAAGGHSDNFPVIPTPDLSAGLCVQDRVDPEVFFPELKQGTNLRTMPEHLREQVNVAKAVCAACPVLNPCRAWAIVAATGDGIYGGLTPAERRVARWNQRSTT